MPFKVKELRQIINHLLKILDIKNYQLSITLVDNNKIKQLNKRFLKRDSATDVLSFPYEVKDKEIDAEIIISVEKAYEMADKLNIKPEEELILYLVHGLLHLLGYNDDTPYRRRKMFQRQHDIIQILKEKCPLANLLKA